EALKLKPGIDGFLRQATTEVFNLPSTVAALKQAVGIGEADAAAPKAQGVAGLRTTPMSPQIAGAVGGRGAASAARGGVGLGNERNLGRPAQVGNERLANPAQQRMPDQQPAAMPGKHPVRAP